MAAKLRVLRRADDSSRQPLTAAVALTAASAPVEDPQSLFKTPIGGSRREPDWQAEAWEHYYGVGEFRYFVEWLSNSCSRCELVASEIGEDGKPTGSIAEDNAEGKIVAALVRMVAGGVQGQAELIKRAAQQLKVPGEYWNAILQTDKGEKWFVVTKDEMKKTLRGVTITLPDGSEHEFNKAKGDGMFRVWNPDPRKAWLPDSTARGVAASLREILQTDLTISDAGDSRLANNGILFVPSEASLPVATPPVSADKIGEDGDPPDEEPAQVPVAQGLQNLIVEVAAETRKNRNSPGRFVPIVAAAPGEHLGQIKHVPLSKEITETALDTREKAIDRLAAGLDVSVERLKGMGGTNHWSSRNIEDQDVQLHIKPVMQPICQGMYANCVANLLTKIGIDPDKYTIWFDASGLTSDPDKTDEIKDAFEQGAATSEALLSYYGLSADSAYDLSTDEGKAQWALDMIGRNPDLVTTLYVLVPELADIEFPQPRPVLPPSQQEDDDPPDESGAEDGLEPDTEDDDADEPVAAAIAGGGAALSMLIEERITQALRLAGQRRVNSGDGAQKARLAGVEPHRYHQLMPAVAEHEIPRLVRAWDDGLDEVAERHRFDVNLVRLVVMQEVCKQLTSPVVDA